MDENNVEKLWLLIEIETADGRNSYCIVDSDEVIGHPNKNNMHTGSAIYIRKGKQAVQATIVIISDDKKFLDTELKQLRKMSAANLAMNVKRSDNNKKRRRTTLADSSKQSHTSNPSWISNSNSVEHVVGSYQIPPMTFDQQTQTEHKLSNELNYNQLEKLLGSQEKFIEEQKIHKNDSDEMKKFILELSEKIDSLQNMMCDFQLQLKSKNNERNMIVVRENIDNTDKTIDSWKNISEMIEESEELYEIQTIEKNDVSHTTPQTNSTRVSLNDSTPSSILYSEYKPPLNNLNIQSRANSNISLNSSASSSITNSVAEWLRTKSDKETEYVSIGNNKTMVPQQIIERINWKQHTAATRKLLAHIFTRDTLATHSLTGKPSPAFIDQKKPIKKQLDPEKVSDIIQIVTKFCKVPETYVRNCITTKCADENKMRRNRLEKSIKDEPNSNKENVNDST